MPGFRAEGGKANPPNSSEVKKTFSLKIVAMIIPRVALGRHFHARPGWAWMNHPLVFILRK